MGRGWAAIRWACMTLVGWQASLAELFPVYGGIVTTGSDFIPHITLGQVGREEGA